MTRQDQKLYMTLLKDLRRIHRKMQDPDNWGRWGICGELVTLRSAADEFKPLAARWPKYSGSELFPVPAPIGASAHYETAQTYGRPSDFWNRETSEYAALRWELLEWCIAELESRR